MSDERTLYFTTPSELDTLLDAIKVNSRDEAEHEAHLIIIWFEETKRNYAMLLSVLNGESVIYWDKKASRVKAKARKADASASGVPDN